MGLEAVEFINDLVPTWPLPTDLRREGDDHLRAIKRALKNTFPKMNAATQVTPEELDNLPANAAGSITEILKHIVPKGTIVMWSGATGDIPSGWALCNGGTVQGFVTPDLRAKFVKGWSGSNPVGVTGGEFVATTESAGVHSHTVAGSALTVAQLAPHSHRFYATNGSTDFNAQGWDKSSNMSFPGNEIAPHGFRQTNDAGTSVIESTGGGQTHAHGLSSDGAHTHEVSIQPPFYTVAFIVKVTDYVAPT